MTKFFRKIRQNVLAEKKVSRFLIYSIGEIILVVVGILIAVKIDDLNQEAQQEAQQKKYFEGIIIDLKRDSIHFEQLHNDFKIHLDHYYTIFKGIKDNSISVVPRDIELMLYNRTFAPVTQKNHQVTIDKITNAEVRTLLNDYFANQELAKEGMDEFNKNIVEQSRPFIQSMDALHYDSVFHDNKYGFLPSVSLIKKERIPILLQDKRILQILAFLRISSGLVISDLKRLKTKNSTLIKRLDKISKEKN